MLFDGGWPYLTRGRALVLILALLGLGWLLLQIFQPDPTRLSLWRGPGGNGISVQAGAASNSLSAVMAPQTGQGLSDPLRPWGNPLQAANTVMTQGYGVGSHAPAEVWGAVDLALDGNGDGNADPEGTWSKPVYATHSGVIKTTADSWPAGNHVWVTNDQYRTGYAHLQSFAVRNGQMVARGDLIGYIGSTGQSSGPHLDYQVWQKQGGRWVNVNPLDFNVLELVR